MVHRLLDEPQIPGRAQELRREVVSHVVAAEVLDAGTAQGRLLAAAIAVGRERTAQTFLPTALHLVCPDLWQRRALHFGGDQIGIEIRDREPGEALGLDPYADAPVGQVDVELLQIERGPQAQAARQEEGREGVEVQPQLAPECFGLGLGHLAISGRRLAPPQRRPVNPVRLAADAPDP